MTQKVTFATNRRSMKTKIGIVLISFFVLSACGDSFIKKPEGLVPAKQMVDMLVDLHLADALYEQKSNRLGPNKLQIKAEDFYYSVLEKYGVADSVFEKSMVYYASFPKDFEKIYAEALDRVNLMREASSLKDPQPVTIPNDYSR
jgi:hypothetical protein